MNILGTEWLTLTEAAVVARVSLRNVNRAVDEKILPEHLYRLSEDGTRQLRSDGCVLLSFYFEAGDRLTAEERLRIVAVASKQLTEDSGSPLEEAWTVRQDFLTVDLAPFLRGVQQRLARLHAARALVVEDPEIMSGTPVIRGTRVPAYDIAASVAADLPLKRILDAYPTIASEDVELAALYAEAYPLRGRPYRSRTLPVGAVIVSYGRVPLRKSLKQAS